MPWWAGWLSFGGVWCLHSCDPLLGRTECLVYIADEPRCLFATAIRLIADSNYCFGFYVASAGHSWCVWPFMLLLLSMRLSHLIWERLTFSDPPDVYLVSLVGLSGSLRCQLRPDHDYLSFQLLLKKLTNVQKDLFILSGCVCVSVCEPLFDFVYSI